MSNIDEVIARSRQPGEFKEKKRFTVARQEAIQKMRKFALASPYNYILELIQAANANGATYIDIRVDRTSTTLSYVGGGFSPSDLAQLFDFLFTSKDRLDLAALRQLALGVNAIMHADPSRVIIESGKGTLKSTSRVVISDHGKSVDVGVPERPLDGTYVRAEGLNRKKLGDAEPREQFVIEGACLAAPVPVLFNDEPVFGTRSMKIPKLAGYSRVVTFDEGDLYGAIGIASTQNMAAFRLMTYGVWVQSLTYDFGLPVQVGGVVSFNRLRKTADHASIVHDEVLDELWIRLRPYVAKLAGGESGATKFDVHLLGQETLLAPVALRQLARQAKSVVAFSRRQLTTPRAVALAEEFGRVLDGPVLVYGNEEPRSLVVLAAPTPVNFPVLSEEELAFHRLPVAQPPALPWLDEAHTLKSVVHAELNPKLTEFEALPAIQAFRKALGSNASIEVTAYLPAADPTPGVSPCEVRIAQRTAWVGKLPIAGFHLVIDLPEVSFSAVAAATQEGTSVAVAEVLASVVLELRRPELESIVHGLLGRLTSRSTSPNARNLALARVAGAMMLRFLPAGPGHVDIRYEPIAGTPRELLKIPMFKAGGRELAIEALPERMKSAGLLYGVLSGQGADTQGIQQDDLLEVEPYQEPLLRRMFGEASFVHVDHRDVLATAEGWQVRDFAWGIRTFPERPLLAEGTGEWTREIEDSLLDQLLAMGLRGTHESQVSEDLRRHARRHLAYYAFHVDRADDRKAVRARPLFMTLDGQVASMNDLEVYIQHHGAVPMADGWASDGAALQELNRLKPWQGGDLVLAPNPFIATLLARRDLLQTAAQPVAGSGASSTGREVFQTLRFADAAITGTAGFPTTRVLAPRLEVVDVRARQTYHLDGVARQFGVVGQLFCELLVPGVIQELEDKVTSAARRELQDILVACEKGQGAHHERMLEVLFDFAAHHLEVRDHELLCEDPLASRVLQMLLFETPYGVPVHARHVLERHLRDAQIGVPDRWRQNVVSGPAAGMRWLEAMADGRLVQVSSSPRQVADPGSSVTDLLRWARATIQQLRPDVYVTPELIPVSLGPDSGLTSTQSLSQGVKINVDHWLVQNALGPHGQRQARWLVLSIYAFLNDLRHEITNAHELAFQARMVDAVLESQKPARK